MKAPNGRLSGDGSAQACRHGEPFGGSYPQIYFVLKIGTGCQHAGYLYYSKNWVAQNLRLGRGLDRTDLDRWKFMHAVLLEMHYKNIHKELLIFIEYPVLEETFNVSTIETASEAKYVLVDCTGKTFAE